MSSGYVHTTSLPAGSAFVRGVRHAFGLPALCYWSSCLAFGFFARDAGVDWSRGIAAAAINWQSTKVLLVTAELNGYALPLVTVTALICALSLLPVSALISHHMEGGVFTKLLLAPTMILTIWLAVNRGEALPRANRLAFLAGVCLTFFLGNLACTLAAWFPPFAPTPQAMMAMALVMPLLDGLSLLGAAASRSTLAMLAMAFFSEPMIATMAPRASVLIAGIASFALISAYRRWRSV